ncbi:MAG: low-specificity L-threonine aldolase [Lutispora sp.]|nr:low-specificity L-threonine aldolase [Lutispora sp.]MDD4833154.1 low-specificity L-threonine aldolase [Lutispora sp.]
MRYIDLRSDTVTMPTVEMRKAMFEAEVGDDVYGDDPTINALEKLSAEIVGKEAAMFVPSGTMGNQLGVMTHTFRGDEVILGENAHIAVHEVGATAVLSGVQLRTIKSSDDILYPELIQKAIRFDDIHEPRTGLICLENALANGTVVPLDVMKKIFEIAKHHQIPIHLDGARLFNAATALGVSAAQIVQYTDSVQFCISKGLCAPIGSMLAGTKAFINKARKNRKLLGGGMRQAGILAAAGIIALEKMTKRLEEDHENARYLGKRLLEIPGVELDLEKIHINMVFFKLNRPSFNPDVLVSKFFEKGIKINGEEGGLFRFVTNNDVSKKDIDFVIDSMKEILL